MRIHFLTQPWARALPPSESIAIWTREVGRRLADRHEVVVWARRGRHERAKIQEDGVEYRFVVGNGDYRLEQLLTSRFDRLRSPQRPPFASPLYNAAYHLAIARGLARAKPDVVHIQNFSQVVPLVRRACPQALIVLHMHCEWLNQLDRRMIARRLAKADLVLGCSNHITDAARAAFPEYADRFHTVYEGVDIDNFRQSSRTRTDDDPLQLLFVARVSPEKGVHVLVDAFTRLAAARPELRLAVIGGEGVMPREFGLDLDSNERVQALEPLWHAGYLEDCRERIPSQFRDRVEFIPWMPQAGLAERMASADIFIVPSVWEEPFGTPVIEAMASRLPVIATRVGGIPELITHHVDGWLVPPGDPAALADAIDTLANDPTTRTAIASAAPTRAQRFAFEQITDAVEQLYETRIASQDTPSS